MKRYTKTIDGKQVIKPANKIVINKDGMNIFNPKKEMILADGWEEYISPVYEETIEDVRRNKLDEIEHYDKSKEIEEFTMNGISLWLDRSERETLDRRFNIELKNGKRESVLWKNGIAFQLVIEEALVMLDAIEMYAISTYDTTQQHLANVNMLQTIEDINNYDYRQGYPEKLNF
jgi:hypothetical protein